MLISSLSSGLSPDTRLVLGTDLLQRNTAGPPKIN